MARGCPKDYEKGAARVAKMIAIVWRIDHGKGQQEMVCRTGRSLHVARRGRLRYEGVGLMLEQQNMGSKVQRCTGG